MRRFLGVGRRVGIKGAKTLTLIFGVGSHRLPALVERVKLAGHGKRVPGRGLKAFPCGVGAH